MPAGEIEKKNERKVSALQAQSPTSTLHTHTRTHIHTQLENVRTLPTVALVSAHGYDHYCWHQRRHSSDFVEQTVTSTNFLHRAMHLRGPD